MGNLTVNKVIDKINLQLRRNVLWHEATWAIRYETSEQIVRRLVEIDKLDQRIADLSV